MDSYLEKMARKTIIDSESIPSPVWFLVEVPMKNWFFEQKNKLMFPYHLIKNIGRFQYQGEDLRYYIHWYNHTWDNSRKIEIPIFHRMFEQNSGKFILEVGDVMNHYRLVYIHDVLDKYEKSVGVINEDIVDYIPKKKYDVVLSISTLEHVGFDEEAKDPKKFIRAIENIRESILAPGGFLVFSVPLGYNPWLDAILHNKILRFDEEIFYLKKGDEWVVTEWENVKSAKMGEAIFIGRVNR